MDIITYSSMKYAEKNRDATLNLTTSNAITILKLKGNAYIYISYLIGSQSLPVQSIDITMPYQKVSVKPKILF